MCGIISYNEAKEVVKMIDIILIILIVLNTILIFYNHLKGNTEEVQDAFMDILILVSIRILLKSLT